MLFSVVWRSRFPVLPIAFRYLVSSGKRQLAGAPEKEGSFFGRDGSRPTGGMPCWHTPLPGMYCGQIFQS